MLGRGSWRTVSFAPKDIKRKSHEACFRGQSPVDGDSTAAEPQEMPMIRRSHQVQSSQNRRRRRRRRRSEREIITSIKNGFRCSNRNHREEAHCYPSFPTSGLHLPLLPPSPGIGFWPCVGAGPTERARGASKWP